MPESRLERTRRAYGEPPKWRAPHDNAAEQLARQGMTANVIEGDHDDEYGSIYTRAQVHYPMK